MISRTQIRTELRKISEVALIRLLGPLPRRIRRSAGRIYASDAYRLLNGLKVKQSTANRMVTDWIAKEYLKSIGGSKDGQLGVAAETVNRDDVGGAASGPAERTAEVSIRPIAETEG